MEEMPRKSAAELETLCDSKQYHRQTLKTKATQHKLSSVNKLAPECSTSSIFAAQVSQKGISGSTEPYKEGRTISVSRRLVSTASAQILRAEFDEISICDSTTGERASRLFGRRRDKCQPLLEQQEQSDEH